MLFPDAPRGPAPAKASRLVLHRVPPVVARNHVAEWHSRLPLTQPGPWKLALVAHDGPTCFGAALWHNPSARMLPQDWLELRRLAVPTDAPPHTASWMLGAMRRWIAEHLPEVTRLVSYQDIAVHTGTIYRAAGWRAAYFSRARHRDRAPLRSGTSRQYRSDINGAAPASAGKIRWEMCPHRGPAGTTVPDEAAVLARAATAGGRPPTR